MSEKIVQLNGEAIKGQLKELVRGSVEETLNELLEAEAEKLTQTGGIVLCKADGIPTSMWTESTCGAAGAESTKMWRFWLRLR